jgi:hypothetical protein
VRKTSVYGNSEKVKSFKKEQWGVIISFMQSEQQENNQECYLIFCFIETSLLA